MSGKKVIQKKAMDDPELQDMFNQMIGTSEPNPRIISPKYEDIMNDATAIIQLIGKVFTPDAEGVLFPVGLVGDFKQVIGEFRSFTETATSELTNFVMEKKSLASGSDMSDINKDPQGLTRFLEAFDRGYDPKKLGETYKALKECNTINRIIIATRDLRKIVEEDKTVKKKKVHDIEDKEQLSESFIKEYRGDSLQLIPSISQMDFKQVWEHPSAVYKFRNRIIYGLHILLKRGSNIVKLIMTPDIDVAKFSEMLIANISKIRRTVPRCDRAFDKIERSVDLLKGNFGGYYKDFVVSKNPGIIVERFVSDVATSSKADRATTFQFKKIISFYRAKIQSQPKDPKIDKIFDLLSTNISVLENKTGQTYDKHQTSKEPKEPKSEEPEEPKSEEPEESEANDKKEEKEIADPELEDELESESEDEDESEDEIANMIASAMNTMEDTTNDVDEAETIPLPPKPQIKELSKRDAKEKQ